MDPTDAIMPSTKHPMDKLEDGKTLCFQGTCNETGEIAFLHYF
jgi:hypothetical protein